MIWREKRWLIITLAVLFLANVIYFFTYRVRYQVRVDELQASLEQTEQQLTQAQQRKTRARSSLAAFENINENIRNIYQDRWSTQRERLTRLLLEVQALERRSRLLPRSTSFTTLTNEKDFGVSSMGLTFTVQGTYAQVRQLINLLEQSPHFLIIDAVSLTDSSSADSQSLNLNLQLKTLFHDPSVAEKPRPLRSM